MTDRVNYGLIGCGMMGGEHIRNIALVPGARVSVVFGGRQPCRPA